MGRNKLPIPAADNSLERIKASLVDERVQLTDHEVEQKDRLLSCYSLCLKGKPDAVVVKMHQQMFAISKSTAHRDLNAAKEMLADVNKSTKSAMRYLVSQLALEGLQLALKENNLSEYNRAIQNLIKVNGLDKEDPDLPDPESFKPNTYLIQINQNFAAPEDQQTVDLNNLHLLPKAEKNILINAVEDSHLSDEQLLKALDA